MATLSLVLVILCLICGLTTPVWSCKKLFGIEIEFASDVAQVINDEIVHTKDKTVIADNIDGKGLYSLTFDNQKPIANPGKFPAKKVSSTATYGNLEIKNEKPFCYTSLDEHKDDWSAIKQYISKQLDTSQSAVQIGKFVIQNVNSNEPKCQLTTGVHIQQLSSAFTSDMGRFPTDWTNPHQAFYEFMEAYTNLDGLDITVDWEAKKLTMGAKKVSTSRITPPSLSALSKGVYEYLDERTRQHKSTHQQEKLYLGKWIPVEQYEKAKQLQAEKEKQKGLNPRGASEFTNFGTSDDTRKDHFRPRCHFNVADLAAALGFQLKSSMKERPYAEKSMSKAEFHKLMAHVADPEYKTMFADLRPSNNIAQYPVEQDEKGVIAVFEFVFSDKILQLINGDQTSSLAKLIRL